MEHATIGFWPTRPENKASAGNSRCRRRDRRIDGPGFRCFEQKMKEGRPHLSSATNHMQVGVYVAVRQPGSGLPLSTAALEAAQRTITTLHPPRPSRSRLALTNLHRHAVPIAELERLDDSPTGRTGKPSTTNRPPAVTHHESSPQWPPATRTESRKPRSSPRRIRPRQRLFSRRSHRRPRAPPPMLPHASTSRPW